MQKTADQIIVECLKQEGIKYWFGSIGEDQHSILDEIYRDGSIRLFDTRHENSGVIVAMGYSQGTGSASVCSGTVGSGVTNMFTGISCAYRSHAPVVGIVCKQAPGFWERDCTKGFDQSAIFKHITKWVIDVDSVDQLADSLQKAFRVATAPPTGPVMVNINRRMLSHEGGRPIETEAPCPPAHYKPRSYHTYADKALIDQACDLLVRARFPAILTDDRLFWNEADTELAELAETMGIPVCSSGRNFGPVLPERSPLWWGTLRPVASPLAVRLAQEVDQWLFVDVDWYLTSSGQFVPFAPFRIVQIDSDPAYIAKLYPVQLGILGHSRTVLRQMLQTVAPLVDQRLKAERLERLGREKNTWLTYLDDELRKVENRVPISPLYLIRTLSNVLNDDAYLTVKGGQIEKTFTMSCVFDAKRPRSVFMGGEDGSLGQAMCKGIGLKLACPDKQVAALCGDGEFWYGNASELETIKRHGVPLVIVISNNGCLGTNHLIQTSRYGKRYIGTHIDNPDFVLLAQSFGMHGERVTDPHELEPALRRALTCGKAAIVDVVTDPDENFEVQSATRCKAFKL